MALSLLDTMETILDLVAEANLQLSLLEEFVPAVSSSGGNESAMVSLGNSLVAIQEVTLDFQKSIPVPFSKTRSTT